MKEIISAPSTPPVVLQHMARMDASYAATFSEEEIRQHAQIAEKIDDDTLAIVDASPIDQNRWRVTVIGYDYLGELITYLRVIVCIWDGHNRQPCFYLRTIDSN